MEQKSSDPPEFHSIFFRSLFPSFPLSLFPFGGCSFCQVHSDPLFSLCLLPPPVLSPTHPLFSPPNGVTDEPTCKPQLPTSTVLSLLLLECEFPLVVPTVTQVTWSVGGCVLLFLSFPSLSCRPLRAPFVFHFLPPKRSFVRYLPSSPPPPFSPPL